VAADTARSTDAGGVDELSRFGFEVGLMHSYAVLRTAFGSCVL
jgi:hypothetical protein